MRAMQIATGIVVNGQIVLEDVPLVEGSVVAVLTRGADESFTLTSAEEDHLLAAMAEIGQGDFISLEDLLGSLPESARS